MVQILVFRSSSTHVPWVNTKDLQVNLICRHVGAIKRDVNIIGHPEGSKICFAQVYNPGIMTWKSCSLCSTTQQQA